jgi:hypothetical protein
MMDVSLKYASIRKERAMCWRARQLLDLQVFALRRQATAIA